MCSDVAREVVAVGERVTRLRPGDRVIGHAAALERSPTQSAEAAFQRLFQADQLALELPRLGAPNRDEMVLVWGGSTSVGANASQLARGAGYRGAARNGSRVR